jgi:hypothetical protein
MVGYPDCSSRHARGMDECCCSLGFIVVAAQYTLFLQSLYAFLQIDPHIQIFSLERIDAQERCEKTLCIAKP